MKKISKFRAVVNYKKMRILGFRVSPKGHSLPKGQSLVEAMVAVALVSVASLAVYPLVLRSKKLVRHADFYSLCVNAARSKINEYRLGTAPVNPKYDSNGAGQMTSDQAALYDAKQSGFSYAKDEYRTDYFNLCPSGDASGTRNVSGTMVTPGGSPPQALAVKKMPPADLTLLGRQECIEGKLPCSTDQRSDDFKLSQILPNFKIFVTLRRFNALLGLEDCMTNIFVSAGGGGGVAYMPSYNFTQTGDMLKIIVTGVVDVSTGAGFIDIDKTSANQNELTCQVSDFLQPAPQIARYWLQDDGRFFRWLGNAEYPDPSLNPWEVFKSVASPGNLGFVVSPDNQYIFVLKHGTLTRFGPCTYDPLDCPLNNRLDWLVDNNIVSISAKFTGADPHSPNPICGKPDEVNGIPVIFGLLADRRTAVCINLPATTGAVPGDPPTPTNSVTYTDQAVVGGKTTYIPFQVPPTNRVHSILMDPTGVTTYVVDTTRASDSGNNDYMHNLYGGGIYNSNDIEMLFPLEAFSVRAIAFSK
jgi:type II secretory pathway pseudopilin PulG